VCRGCQQHIAGGDDAGAAFAKQGNGKGFAGLICHLRFMPRRHRCYYRKPVLEYRYRLEKQAKLGRN